MQYTTLGSTGVEVSRLCFGTMSFGGDADEATSQQMFNRCREAGVNFFDCANVYSAGKAEEILGRFVRSCREELVLTSKVGMVAGQGPNGHGLSRRHILGQVEKTLKRLGTDHLDVYFCHHSDPAVPIEQTLSAMGQLIDQGKVLYLGVSNWTAWQIALALGKSEGSPLPRIHVLQPMYSLAKRTAEIEILPLAADQKLGVISYSPLGGGLLSGKYVAQAETKGRLVANKNYSIRYADPAYHDVARRFAEYAAGLGVHPVTLAVAWVKAHPAITAPIIGSRNLEQLAPSLAAADYVMSPQQWQEIADLTPRMPLATDRDEERKA